MDFLKKIDNFQWRLKVWVQPGSKKDAVTGIHDGCLKVKLQAPPVDGKANQSLCRYLANLIQVPAKNVSIVNGLSSRRKTLLIKGVAESSWDLFFKKYNHFN
ncbi:DUF167 domain-containing protein [Desulfonatronovibrio magnus]|uniref:DUF167 domain-containing protein n=1 Tax=Desulfonatronovibrio magnus TaxID=698827 RepID=UPI0005EB57D7|nr:DUF167 domain-containing protein [Desulfonatronovibrio magnus]RQD66769.1 MAG: DUF167 domain-containing protein [Desulfonatronovibrio sp. MSAO_Bac4]